MKQKKQKKCRVCKGPLEDQYGHSARVGTIEFCVNCMVKILLESSDQYLFINLRKFGKDLGSKATKKKLKLEKLKSRKKNG